MSDTPAQRVFAPTGGRWTLEIPDDAWTEGGTEPAPPPRAALHLPEERALAINGCPMHVEAWAVYDDDHGIQRAVDPLYEEDVERLCSMLAGPAQTTTINGLEYIIVVLPHSA